MLHSDLKDIRLCLSRTRVVASRQLIVGDEINHPAVFSMCANVSVRDYRAAYGIERCPQSPARVSNPHVGTVGGRWQWLQNDFSLERLSRQIVHGRHEMVEISFHRFHDDTF